MDPKLRAYLDAAFKRLYAAQGVHPLAGAVITWIQTELYDQIAGMRAHEKPDVPAPPPDEPQQ